MSATVAVCFSGPRRELHHNYRLNRAVRKERGHLIADTK
jgi:hypothetical protein